jgi:gluconate kinase
VPFTCDACGGRSWPDLLPVVGDVLRCPRCANERPFVRPPLLVVTGTVGSGKSSLCARLAGTIPGALLLDADIFAKDLHGVVPRNEDHRGFWRSMMHLAHELAQNNLTVAYFSTMLPDQVLDNRDALGYFAAVRFLCLDCPPEQLGERLVRREGTAARARLNVWVDFNAALVAAANDLPAASVIDAGRPVDEVEHDVRRWIIDEVVRATWGD